MASFTEYGGMTGILYYSDIQTIDGLCRESEMLSGKAQELYFPVGQTSIGQLSEGYTDNHFQKNTQIIYSVYPVIDIDSNQKSKNEKLNMKKGKNKAENLH